MEVENAKVAAADQPESAADAVAPVALQPERRINLDGHLVLGTWVLSWARHDCNVCHGRGTCKVITHKIPVETFCACAIARARRELKAHLATQAPPVPVDPPARTPDVREQARVARKIEGLQRQLTALETEFGAREERFKRGIEALTSQGMAHAASEQDCASTAIRSSMQVQTYKNAIADAEKSLEDLRLALKGETETRDAAAHARELAMAMMIDVGAEVERQRARFTKDTEGLHGELERARRRLAIAKARYGVSDSPSAEYMQRLLDETKSENEALRAVLPVLPAVMP